MLCNILTLNIRQLFVDKIIMEKDFECVKIKDGLYIGNRLVAMDLQFLIINKFAYIVNCAAQIPNQFEAQGIKYVKFKLYQDKNQIIFDNQLKRLKKIKKIVEQAQQNGMCCLIHCANGYNRSLTILTAYLMDRFKWKLIKTIDFLQSKGVSIMFTENNIQQLKNLQLILSQQYKLTHNWGSPYFDDEEELITKTYINTTKKKNEKNYPIVKEKNLSIKRQYFQQEVVVEKTNKRVQWLDRIEKQIKKERQRLMAEKHKEQKKQNQRSRVKLQQLQQQALSKEAKFTGKDKSDVNKKSKKRIEPELDPQIQKKIEQAQILKLIKKSGKLKKELIIQQIDDQDKPKLSQQPQQNPLKPVFQKQEYNNQDQKKVYKLTINNYINPNINIIKPPLDKKKKTIKPTIKKDKDKFNRTYSEKEAFKKPTFYDKDISKEKQKEKRNAGHTPVRSRKQRKSQKQKDLKF